MYQSVPRSVSIHFGSCCPRMQKMSTLNTAQRMLPLSFTPFRGVSFGSPVFISPILYIDCMKRTLLSWSSGKDGAWSLHRLRQSSEYEVVALLTTFNQS